MIVKGYIKFSCHVAFCDYSTAVWEQAPYDDDPYDFVETDLYITKPFETGITFKSSEDYTDLDEIEFIDFQPSVIEIDADDNSMY